MCMIALVAFAIWGTNASAYTFFSDAENSNLTLSCEQCHTALANFGPGHGAHAAPTNNDCALCHDGGQGPGRNSPPLANCVQCHGRDEDAGGDTESAGLGRGLRIHHQGAGVNCAECHDDANGPVGAPESTLPSFYPGPNLSAQLDPCDGSEERFSSNTVSLDNDGDGLTDGADPDCDANQPPLSDPNGPYNGTVNEPVTFDGSGSNDPDGTIVAYDWDFGDGNTGTGVSPTHTYIATGTFTVTLTVTDDVGATDTATTTATIGEGNQPPVADPNGPYTGTVGEPVTFDGSGSNDPDGTIVAYDWDFGDGNTGTGMTPTHTYAADGTYNVTLTVTDDAGETDSATTTATIGTVPPNQPPVADPNGPYTGTVGEPVTFDSSGSSDPDGTIVAYDWDFGDGNTGTGVSPAHSYAADGMYTVTLAVTDDAGATDTATTTAIIGTVPNQPPIADPNGPYNGTVNEPVTFDGSGSSDPDGTIVAHDWDFGDGNTGTGVSPTHTYIVTGTFTVTLKVTDDAGTTDTATTTATIGEGNQAPAADPNGPYTGTVNEPVTFDGSGSSDPDGTIVAYDWDFGDGNTGTGVSPTHTYATDGTYNVTLTVTDDGGVTDSAMTTATINTDARVVVEAEVEAPEAIKANNRSRTRVEVEFDEDGMPVEIVDLVCYGNESGVRVMPERINAEDEEENEFTALFRTQELRLICKDTAIVCEGTLADGTLFMGEDETRVIRDFEGNRCPHGDDQDKDDDHRH